VTWPLLIIEDDLDIAENLAEVFLARGFHVRIAGNGDEAIARVRAEGFRPAAIVLDLLMPKMDGVEFLQARRAEPLLASTPVIVLTAQPHGLYGLPDAVFARLSKPTPLAVLIDAVHRAVQGQPPGGTAQRHAG
jgi:CheY-like chemotaxis protein